MSDNHAVTVESLNAPASGAHSGRPLPARTIVSCAELLVLAATVEAWLVLADRAGGDARHDFGLADICAVSTVVLSVGGAAALLLAVWRLHRAEQYLFAKRCELAEKERVHATVDAGTAVRWITTELPAKAANQLGSDDARVRLAALSALERLAQDNESQRQAVVNMLCAYLRMPYDAAPPPSSEPPTGPTLDAEEKEVRLAAQRILADHLMPGGDPDNFAEAFWPDMDLDLTGATLIDFVLDEGHVGSAHFNKATFVGDTGLAWTTFTGPASFQDAVFTGSVRFNGTIFTRNVRFDGAAFSGHARFGEAIFDRDARFDRASFDGIAEFDAAIFTGAVTFSRATFASRCRFDEAWTHEGGPAWPPGWTLSATASVPWADAGDGWRQLLPGDGARVDRRRVAG